MKGVKELHQQLSDTELRDKLSDMLHWRVLNHNVIIDPDLTSVSTVLLDEDIEKVESELAQLKQDRFEVETVLKPLLRVCHEKGFKKIALDSYDTFDNHLYSDFIGSEEELSVVFQDYEPSHNEISLSKKKFSYGEKCKLVGLVSSPEHNGKIVEVVCCSVSYSDVDNPSGLEYSVVGQGVSYNRLYGSRLESL